MGKLRIGFILIVLSSSLSGCLPMAAINLIKNDNACEAYNSDVQRGAIDGPEKVCKEPAFRFPS
jgi:hypothetical protein